jgi:hypothetical protein
MLVSSVGRIHRVLDTGLGAGVNILDVIRVLRLKLIKLVHLIFNRGGLPVYPLLAGKRVHVTPEPLLRLTLQRLARCICRAVIRVAG